MPGKREKYGSVGSHSMNDKVTIATLIKELDQKGEDTRELRALASFADVEERVAAADAVLSEYSEDATADLFEAAGEVADTVDPYQLEDGEEETSGGAVSAALALDKGSSSADKMRCIRLIAAADIEESIEAQEILIDRKVMTQGGINKRLKALEVEVKDSIPRIVSDAVRKHVFNEGKHILQEPNGGLYIYRQTHWVPIPRDYLTNLTLSVVEKLKSKVNIKQAEVRLAELAALEVRVKSTGIKKRLHATDRPPAPVINCLNGEIWLDAETGEHELRPHRADSYLTSCLNVEYKPDAKCPLFRKTIFEIFDNALEPAELVRHMGELFGYMIQPNKFIPSWWLFRGDGGDGKSTLIKILDAFLGEAQLKTSVKMLSSMDLGGDNHALASLVGKLSMVIEEVSVHHSLNDAGLKMFSELTTLEANPKHHDSFKFPFVGTLIMCSNGYPVTRDLSRGMLRRANIIPFDRSFEAEGTSDLKRVSRIVSSGSEMSGILLWMLKGYRRLVQRGRFDKPIECLAAFEEWLGYGNNLYRFVLERMKIIDSECRGDCLVDVHEQYLVWCVENGCRPMGRNTMYKEMEIVGKKVGFSIRKDYSNGSYIIGAIMDK